MMWRYMVEMENKGKIVQSRDIKEIIEHKEWQKEREKEKKKKKKKKEWWTANITLSVRSFVNPVERKGWSGLRDILRK